MGNDQCPVKLHDVVTMRLSLFIYAFPSSSSLAHTFVCIMLEKRGRGVFVLVPSVLIPSRDAVC